MNIPDDWDADTDEEEEDSKAVWEAANSKSPMPTILPSQTSTSTPTSLPPLEALKPKMKILKRQTASTGPSEPQHAGNDQGQSLQERERLYREARERIFGQGAVQAPESAPKVEVQIARNPRGPEAGNGSERGFARRKNTSISSEKQLKGEDGVISSTSS
ncbi:hypothetical protein NEOLEDRAFT_1137296 [Neolentinus lepideus HHB14362 ss-1]|uniref:SUZ domain-containing protein n=1 Tax=Neolentinus lepideus HHB14362 ss-1 TaxID=1314782 RepID=A0A165QVK4_9AGAM|nr:hypothetical protein NEOLEDRAFT_1137296 [Neolentinus lepideus HHB14362 ss-1]